MVHLLIFNMNYLFDKNISRKCRNENKIIQYNLKTLYKIHLKLLVENKKIHKIK